LQHAEHLIFLKNNVLQLIGFQAPQAQVGEGVGVKPAPKLSLDRWGCVCKISSRSVQGFGFPLALHIPTDRQTYRQTSKHLYAHLYVYRRLTSFQVAKKVL